MSQSEDIARAFHETYERLAPDHGYETRKASAVPWEDVPEQNKGLMIAVVQSLLDSGTFGSPVVNVHVQGSAVSDQHLAQTIQDQLRRRTPRRTA